MGIISRNSVITISGLPGTGKRELANTIALRHRLELESASVIFRIIATEPKRACTSACLQEQAVNDGGKVDKQVDACLAHVAEKFTRDSSERLLGGVIESSWIRRIVPKGFSVLLVCAESRRIRRIHEYEGFESIELAGREAAVRENALKKRYATLYDEPLECALDPTLFDLVINTTKYDAEQVYRLAKLGIEALSA